MTLVVLLVLGLFGVTLLLLFATMLRKDHKWYFWIPEIINVLIFATAFFPWGVYTITPDNG